MTATVSLIIPAHNASAYIEGSTMSALGQHALDVEVIVVNDGSTDGTRELLAEPAYAQVTIVDQERKGVAAARNAGLRIATGKYVGFLDADDLLMPQWASEVTNLLENGAGIAVADALLIDAEGKASEPPTYYYDSLRFPPARKQRRRIVSENFILSTACVRRADVLNAKGFDEELSGVEDWDLWMRLIISGCRAELSPRKLSCYRRGHASMSSRVREMKLEERGLLVKAQNFPLTLSEHMRRLWTLSATRAYIRQLDAEALRDHDAYRAAALFFLAGLRLRSWESIRKGVMLPVCHHRRRSRDHNA